MRMWQAPNLQSQPQGQTVEMAEKWGGPFGAEHPPIQSATADPELCGQRKTIFCLILDSSYLGVFAE